MRRHPWLVLCLLALLLLVALPWRPAGEIRAGRRRAVSDAVDALSSHRYEERERALRRLVSLGDAARPALERALRSPLAEVRVRAAAALREMDRRRESPETRRFREYRRIVRIGLDREDALKPGTARFTVLLLDRDLAARATVSAARELDRDLVRQRRAVRLLCDLGSPAAAPWLAGLLDRPLTLPSILFLAADGLLRCGVTELPPAVRDAVGNRDPECRKYAVRVLAGLGTAADLPLARRAARDPEAGVRREAPAALLRLGARHALPDLLHLARDPEAVVRVSALRALRRLPGPEPAAAARAALRDPAAEVRAAALACLGNRGGERDRPGVEAGLGDPSAIVRREAVRTLVRFGRIGSAVARGLEDRTATVRRVALLAARNLPLADRRRLLAAAPRERDPYLTELRKTLVRPRRTN